MKGTVPVINQLVFYSSFIIHHSSFLKDWLEQKRVEEQPRRGAPDGAEVGVFGVEDDVAFAGRLVDDVGGAAQKFLGRRPDEAREVERLARVVAEDERVGAFLRGAEEVGRIDEHGQRRRLVAVGQRRRPVQRRLHDRAGHGLGHSAGPRRGRGDGRQVGRGAFHLLRLRGGDLLLLGRRGGGLLLPPAARRRLLVRRRGRGRRRRS